MNSMEFTTCYTNSVGLNKNNVKKFSELYLLVVDASYINPYFQSSDNQLMYCSNFKNIYTDL